MLIKYVLFAILIVLLASILYDGFRQFLAKRKEKRTLQSKQDKARHPAGDSEEPPGDGENNPPV